MTDRRAFLRFCALAGFAPAVGEGLWNRLEAEKATTASRGPQSVRPAQITGDMVKAAAALVGLEYTESERELMLGLLESNLESYEALRGVHFPQATLPALRFSPLLPGHPPPAAPRARRAVAPRRLLPERPATNADLAFLGVVELGELIRARRVTSTELTRVYLDRLRRFNPALRCVVNLTEERAFRKAAEADRAIAAGKYLGPLHGIPYGVKDLLSVPGYPTTWGAAIYKDRILETTATAVERLDAAGAVLIAKLSTGELALNQTWFGGQTMNAWRRTEGAGGSSGGSAVATSAGLVGFALGTETIGSIVTPATRNGVSRLRPTFGRVSRHGTMTLCWSLDKVGPIARSIEDCAVVLEAIAGPDDKDPTVVPVPFAWDPGRPLSSVRVGYFKAAFDAPRQGKRRDDIALGQLRKLGVNLVEVDLPTDIPLDALKIILVEAAAGFDEITRTGEIDLLAEQHSTAWPNFFRSSRLIPAVEYLQANRIRTLLMQRMEAVFREVDVFVAPTFGVVLVTNLTGHPCAVCPNGFNDDDLPASLSFIGKLYGEAELCTVARAWQEASGWHRRRPSGYTD
jgi:Asp-tRNA(Asn)/Glu-tRNA(Gln) amidotransferase A subunit family amidase